MAQILVRDLEPALIEQLKSQAREHGRSLQGEVKAILESSSRLTPSDARALAEQWRGRLAGRTWSSSVDLIREDRER